jgi:hypothetical protein
VYTYAPERINGEFYQNGRENKYAKMDSYFCGSSWAYEEYSSWFCAMLQISVNTIFIWSK